MQCLVKEKTTKEKIHLYPDVNSNIVLCFIGREFYSKPKFLREAKAFGFSRLTNFIVPKGSPVIFAQGREAFAIGEITGYTLPDEIVKSLEKEGIVKVHDSAPMVENRGCGSLLISGSYEVGNEGRFIEKVNELIKQIKKEQKRLPKIFMRGVIKSICKYKLIADYARLPYRVKILFPNTIDFENSDVLLAPNYNFIHDENNYALRRKYA